MTAQQPSPSPGLAAAGTGTFTGTGSTTGTEALALPHDFDAQKELHQQIRNDPDYDDWEYGTEPLPHEAWLNPKPSA